MGGNGADITWESVEWFGQGLNPDGNNNSETYFWLADSPLTNVIITHSYLHNAGTTFLLSPMVAGTMEVLTIIMSGVCLMAHTNHGEAIQLQGSNSGDVVQH